MDDDAFTVLEKGLSEHVANMDEDELREGLKLFIAESGREIVRHLARRLNF